MAASAWVLARRGRCGPCIALMTKKVDKTFHEREIWAVKKLARRAVSLLLALKYSASCDFALHLVTPLGGLVGQVKVLVEAQAQAHARAGWPLLRPGDTGSEAHSMRDFAILARLLVPAGARRV